MNQAVKTSICSALIVDREAFLWECFAQQVPDSIREQLRTCAPAAAGVDEQQIEQVSRALIHAHAARASAASLSASLAQGILRLFTIPVEYAAFVYEALRLTQKLLYLHTGMRQEQLLSHHQLSGYLYIFFGGTLTLKASGITLEVLIKTTLRRFLSGRMATLAPIAGCACSTAFTCTVFLQLAEAFRQTLVERCAQQQEYLTIGCTERPAIQMPLFVVEEA